MKQHGFQLLYTPYANLAGMHSFYGANWGAKFLLGKDWTTDLDGYKGLSLKEIVENAFSGKKKTGLGPLPVHVYYFRVMTCYALILKEYCSNLFVPWIKKFYDDFVECRTNHLWEGRQQITRRALREAIFLVSLEVIKEGSAWIPESQVSMRVQSAAALSHAERQSQTCRMMEDVRAGQSPELSMVAAPLANSNGLEGHLDKGRAG